MNEYFLLQSTYDIVLEFSTNIRSVRIEILRSTENPKKFRTRVWDQNTYNLYPTFANMPKEGGITNKMMSCDEINREITTLLSAEDDPSDLIFGKEWESEEELLLHLKGLIQKYHASLCE